MPSTFYLLSDQKDIQIALKDLIRQNSDLPFEILSPASFSSRELITNAWVLIDLTDSPGKNLKLVEDMFMVRPDLLHIILHNYLPNSIIKKYREFENVFFVDIIHAPVFLGEMLEKAGR